VGQGLIGIIADNRGARIGDLYTEFGVNVQDWGCWSWGIVKCGRRMALWIGLEYKEMHCKELATRKRETLSWFSWGGIFGVLVEIPICFNLRSATFIFAWEMIERAKLNEKKWYMNLYRVMW
jgi:hypothetical protein